MDRRQFNGIIDVGGELSGALPCGYRFGGAVPKAAAQRASICDLKLEPAQGPARLVGWRIGDGNRLAEMGDCLGICRASQCLLTGLAPPLKRCPTQPRLSEVVSQNFRLGLG